MDRGHVIVSVCLHEVISCKELICREYAVEVLARDAHELRESGSGTYEYRRKSFLIKERVDCNCPSGDHVCLDLYAKSLYGLYFRRYNLVLWKAELRNTIFKHSARTVESFEDSHLISELREVRCTCKACRATSDHSDLMAVCRSYLRLHATVLTAPVCHETLELSDCYRLALHAKDTASFALRLLRTYAAADCRKR